MHVIQEAQEGTFSSVLPEPLLTDDGVRFSVKIELRIRSCLVTTEALHFVAREHGFSMDAINTYYAFEAKINSTARSLVFRGATDYPLVLGPGSFH